MLGASGFKKIAFPIGLLVLGASSSLWAQHHRGHHVHHHGRLPVYDASTETTLEGTVEEVVLIERSGCPTCDGTTRLFLDGHDAEIHLCPPEYLESQGCVVREDDSVRITDSRLVLANSAVVLAREIHCDGRSITLRDGSGRPMWSRPRR